MTAVRPWFPFHVPDYRADTGRISTLEHGAYCLLLQEYWLGGPLPDNDEVLAGVAKLDLKVWQQKVGPVVRLFFQRHSDGLLHQKRADIERERALKLTDVRATAGATGGAKTRAKRVANVEANASAKPQKTRARARATLNISSSLRSEESARYARAPEQQNGIGHHAPPSARDDLWAEGLPVVMGLTGKPRGPAAKLLGRWLKATNDDCSVVLAAIERAAADRPVDPVAWITAAVAQTRRSSEDRIGEDWNLPKMNQAALDAMEDDR